MAKVKYVCYECGEGVDLDELELVDMLVEDLDEDQSEILADHFVHCTGPTYKFHDDGTVNCCQKCFYEITG